jgi:hypothetical protein
MTEEEMERRGNEAVERIARAMGRPVLPPLSEEERRAFWAEQARIDEELAHRYGPPLTDQEVQAYLAGQQRVGDRGCRCRTPDAA